MWVKHGGFQHSHFLITFTDKLCVICISLSNSICAHSILRPLVSECFPFFTSFTGVSCNSSNACHKGKHFICFTLSSDHDISTEIEKNPVCLRTGTVSVSVRGLRPGKADIHRIWKWADRDTPSCRISSWGCVCPAYQLKEKKAHGIIFFCLVLFLPLICASLLMFPDHLTHFTHFSPVAHLWIYRSSVWWF